MDFFLSSRQEEIDETNTIFLLGQISANAHAREEDPYQVTYRSCLLRKLQNTSLPGASRVSTWEEAVQFVRDQARKQSERESFETFDFECTALDMQDLHDYFRHEYYRGPPLPACLASGANGRTYVLENILYDPTVDLQPPLPQAVDGQEPVQAPAIEFKYALSTTLDNVRSIPIGNVVLVSPSQEVSCVCFLDEKRSVVDWKTTIHNLKGFAINSEYSYLMVKTALMNFVRMFRPADQELLSKQSANEIAKFLLKTTSTVDRRLHHLERLEKASRIQGESLMEALAKVRLLVEQVYPGSGSARQREAIMLQALISFSDSVASNMIKKSVVSMQRLNREPNLDRLVEQVMRYELETGKYPTKTLYMSRQANLSSTFMAAQSSLDPSLGDSLVDNVQVMASRGKSLTIPVEEDDRRRLWWQFDSGSTRRKSPARQRKGSVPAPSRSPNPRKPEPEKSPPEIKHPFFTLSSGTPTLFFPNPSQTEGFCKVSADSMPTPDIFLQAVDLVSTGLDEDKLPFLEQLSQYPATKNVTQKEALKAAGKQVPLADEVVQLTQGRIQQNLKYRNKLRDPKTSKHFTSKSNPVSRDSSASSFRSATSRTSSPASSRPSSDTEQVYSRGSVKKSVYSRESSAEKPKSKPAGGTKKRSEKQNSDAPRSSRQRQRSSSVKRFLRFRSQFPDMKPGLNCRPSYSPDLGQTCVKCMTDQDMDNPHFEFRCPKYESYNKDPCKTCSNGYHLETQCESKAKVYPPPVVNENNLDTESKIAQLQRQLELLLASEKN